MLVLGQIRTTWSVLSQHLIGVYVANGLLLQEILLLLHHPAKLLLWHSTTDLLLLLLLLLLLETVVFLVHVVPAVAAHVPLRRTLLAEDVTTYLSGRARQNIFVSCLSIAVHPILSCRIALMAHELLRAVPARMGRRNVKSAGISVIPIFVALDVIFVVVAAIVDIVITVVTVVVVIFVALVAVVTIAVAAAAAGPIATGAIPVL